MSLGSLAATPPIRQDAKTPDWAVADVQEFVPRRLEPSVVRPADRPIYLPLD